jgi:hypothetical protein
MAMEVVEDLQGEVQTRHNHQIPAVGNTNKPLKKTLSDKIYYLGSAKQAAGYETMADFLINHIMNTFNFCSD